MDGINCLGCRIIDIRLRIKVGDRYKARNRFRVRRAMSYHSRRYLSIISSTLDREKLGKRIWYIIGGLVVDIPSSCASIITPDTL